MQTKTALSTTEAEFIALSEGLWTIIPIMNLMEEMQEQGLSMMNSKAEIKCKVFEDSSWAFNYSYVAKNTTKDQIHKHQVLALQGASGTRKSNNTSGIYQGSNS